MSIQVNFSYLEHGEKKNALVKLRKLRLLGDDDDDDDDDGISQLKY